MYFNTEEETIKNIYLYLHVLMSLKNEQLMLSHMSQALQYPVISTL